MKAWRHSNWLCQPIAQARLLRHDRRCNKRSVSRMRSFGWPKCFFLGIVGFLNGCGSFPNRVESPAIKYTATQTGVKKTEYMVGDKTIGYRVGSQTGGTVLPVETTLEGVQTQILAMQSSYISQEDSLLLTVDMTSNLQFLGMIVSAAGIATKARDWRNSGAGVAGLSNLWSSHYGIAVQATNYRLAAQALDCVSSEIDYITPSFWSSAYDVHGVFQVTRENFAIDGASDADVTAGYDTLVNMYPNLHKTIVAIDRKLRALQASVQIPTVSVSDIQDAVTHKAEAKKVGEAATDKTQKKAAQELQGLQDKLSQAQQTAAASQAAADMAARALANAKAMAQSQRSIVETSTQTEAGERANFRALQSLEIPAQLLTADATAKTEFLERNKKALPEAKRKASEALQTLANDSAKQTALDDIEKDIEATAQQTAEQARKDAQAAKEAADKVAAKKTYVELLNLGVLSKAIQLPASLRSCVAVMGK